MRLDLSESALVLCEADFKCTLICNSELNCEPRYPLQIDVESQEVPSSVWATSRSRRSFFDVMRRTFLQLLRGLIDFFHHGVCPDLVW
jgi:hypothetical protein